MLVELVMGKQVVLDVEMLKKDARCAGILGQHHIGLFQDAYGAQGHVLHVAHWCGYDVKYSHFSDKYTYLFSTTQITRHFFAIFSTRDSSND